MRLPWDRIRFCHWLLRLVTRKEGTAPAGTLYVVGTPIGNLEDLSPRASRVLGEVSLVAAEDTRVARRLLAHLGVHPRLLSFNEHNWPRRLDSVLGALDEGNVALVSDAGMPGISDPGRELVAAAAARGIRVESVPGPSAVTTALSVSGLPADAFQFLGFLPRRRRERIATLREAATTPLTLVLFEAPHRLRATLEDIAATFGDRPVAVCRELTKLYEEVYRGTPSGALDHFDAPRGEFVIVLAGAPAQEPTDSPAADELQGLLEFLSEMRAEGVPARRAVSEAASRFGIPRNRAYQLWLESSSSTTS